MLASRRAASHGASFFFSGRSVETRGTFARGARLGRDLSRDARRETRNVFENVFDEPPRATPERSQRVPSIAGHARGEARAVRPLARASRRERGAARRERKKRILRPPRAGSAPRAGRRRRRLRRKRHLSGACAVPRAELPVRVALGRARRGCRAAPSARVRRAVRAGLRRVGRAGVRTARALRASRALRAGGRAVAQLRVPRVSARAIGGGGGG